MGKKIYLRASHGRNVEAGYAGRKKLSSDEALVVEFDADVQPEKIAKALKQMSGLVQTRKAYKLAEVQDRPDNQVQDKAKDRRREQARAKAEAEEKAKAEADAKAKAKEADAERERQIAEEMAQLEGENSESEKSDG